MLTARCYTVGKYMCECESPTTTPHPHFLNETMRPVGYHSDRRLIRLAVVERTRNPLKQCAEYNMPDGASSPLRNPTQQPRTTLARRTPICNPHTIYSTCAAQRTTEPPQNHQSSLRYQQLCCQTVTATPNPTHTLQPSLYIRTRTSNKTMHGFLMPQTEAVETLIPTTTDI